MLFNIIKCKSCDCNMQVDSDSTISAYMDNEFKNESNLIITEESPPVVPDYVILKCENRDCSSILKLTFKEFFDKLVEFWTNMAYKRSQMEARELYTFDKYATKYLVDETTRRVVTKKDIEGNLVLKDIFELTEKNK